MDSMKLGFTYTIEAVKDGQVIDSETVHNLIPIEGLNHILDVALKNGTAQAAFYVGLFEGAYTPIPADTMATFPGTATELTAYSETTRQVLTLGAIAAGQADNVDSKAVFTGPTNGKQAHGGFISSSPTKGSTTGVLISAVRFSSPKTFDSGTELRVTCAFSAVSV
jgi:hypothetical protein